MLKGLVLENFKAIGSRQVVPLAPITLIFGPNSAGKSSLIQSLLLLEQTLVEGVDQEAPLLMRGRLVDAGSFGQMVFRHDRSRVCEITPLFASAEAVPVEQPWLTAVLGELDRGTTFGIGVAVRFDGALSAGVFATLPSTSATPRSRGASPSKSSIRRLTTSSTTRRSMSWRPGPF